MLFLCLFTSSTHTHNTKSIHHGPPPHCQACSVRHCKESRSIHGCQGSLRCVHHFLLNHLSLVRMPLLPVVIRVPSSVSPNSRDQQAHFAHFRTCYYERPPLNHDLIHPEHIGIEASSGCAEGVLSFPTKVWSHATVSHSEVVCRFEFSLLKGNSTVDTVFPCPSLPRHHHHDNHNRLNNHHRL